MITRGFIRGLAIFLVIVMTLMLILLPILAGVGLAEKIGFGLLWGLFILFMITVISGRFWDDVHSQVDDQAKNGANKE